VSTLVDIERAEHTKGARGLTSDPRERRRLRLVPFLVTLSYREPTYAQRRGLDPKTHHRTYRVIAASPDDAIVMAHDLFYREVVASNVGWAREILGASAEWMASA
jgi:hypothetical protein